MSSRLKSKAVPTIKLKTKEKKIEHSYEICSICDEETNKTNRKIVSCPYCSESSCLQCAKNYISTKIADPHCMHCMVAWNTFFVKNTFPASWLNKDYKNIREELLFDAELAKIPDSQRFCEAAKTKIDLSKEKEILSKKLKINKEDIEKTKKKYDFINEDIWLLSEQKCHENDRKLEKLKDESHALSKHLKSLHLQSEEINDILDNIEVKIQKFTNFIEGISSNVKLDNKFHMACQSNTCKGFVNDDWKCGLCFKTTCSECHEIKDLKSHICDEDKKRNIEYLKEDSKPCPRCASFIHKISGCDQMWCTQCRFTFSWRTGEEETHVHNPHYYEWLVQNNAGNNVRQHVENCEQYVSEQSTYHLVTKIRSKFENSKEKEKIMNLVRLLIHINQVELASLTPSYLKRIPHDPNRDIRIEYMLNNITKEEFKFALQKREKDRLKKEDFHQIFTMFKDVTDDMLHELIENNGDVSLFDEKLEKIRIYTNNCLEETSNQNNMKKYKFIPEDYGDIILTRI